MTTKKYTKKEIELYGNLAKVYSVHKKMMSIFNDNIVKLVVGKNDVIKEFIGNLWDMELILKEAKIPKKILILNSLEDKKNG